MTEDIIHYLRECNRLVLLLRSCDDDEREDYLDELDSVLESLNTELD